MDNMRDKEFENEKLDSFYEATQELGVYDDFFGFSHQAGFNKEEETCMLVRRVINTPDNAPCAEIIFEDYCYDCAMKFIEGYKSALEMAVKTMAGVPERMVAIYGKQNKQN